MKTCNKCKIPKELSDFSKSAKQLDGLNSICRSCDSEYKKKNYQKDPIGYNKKVVELRRQRRAKLDEYLKSLNLKCLRCNEDHPAILDFHHLDPTTKLMEVGKMRSSGLYNLARIKEEIVKCIVLCSNCHRKLHYDERNCRVAESANVSNILLDVDKQV